MRIGVECGPGAGDEHLPVRLLLGARALDVLEVLDRWFGVDHTYVKLAAADGATYILRHDAPSDRWDLVMFDKGGGGARAAAGGP